MKIVIDIDENVFTRLFDPGVESYAIAHDMFVITKSIRNGKPLPKGHGDLIDRKDLIENAYTKGFCSWYDEIKMADTIIEADKESEEEDEII